MKTRLPLALAALLPALACSSGDSLPPLATATIGPDGGVIEVSDGDYAGLRVEVPAGALTSPTAIRALPAFASAAAGFRTLGRGVVFEPADLEFRLPVQLTLPYDAGSQVTNDVSFLVRPASGPLLQLAPATQDPANPIATLSVTTLSPGGARSTLFVGEQYFNGFRITDYVALADGNRWEFEGGLTLTVTATSTAPNFDSLPLFELRFATAERDFGVWLEPDGLGDFRLRGEFQTVGADSYQHTHPESLFVPFFVTLGQPVRSTYEFAGYAPFGATSASFAGFGVSDIVVTKPEGSVITAAGEFEDLVRCEIAMQVSRIGGARLEERLALTFAADVGPVAATVFGVSRGLLRAVVDGVPIPATGR